MSIAARATGASTLKRMTHGRRVQSHPYQQYNSTRVDEGRKMMNYCRDKNEGVILFYFILFYFILFYFIFSRTFTFQLLDKPWSQVSSLLLPVLSINFYRA